MQACYSGQIVNGSAKVESYASIPPTVALDGTLPDEILRDLFVDRDELAETRDSYATPDYGQLAEQILVLSASSKSEMSQYSSDGSHFTKALHKTFKELGSSPGSTMREFLEQVQKNVRSSRPQYRAEPEDVILGEPLRQAMNAQRRYIYAFFNDRSELWVRGVEPLSQVNFCLGVSPDAARACAQAMQGVSSQGMFYLPLNIPNTAREYYVGIDGRYYGANDNVLQLVKIKRRQS